MTANTIYSDPERVVETGMNDYLPKPISQDRLQAMLQRYASGKPNLNPEPEPPRPQIDTSIPLLGDDVLGYLLDEFSSDTVAELIEDYTSHSKDLLSQVLTANEAGDMDMVEYGIHTLKGMSGALGALRLTETCQEILEACRKQQAKHVESQLKDLPDMAQETQRALEAWRVRG
jgi:HPt (histidine-containing phosphotransfer) domain-containing protein